MRSMKLRRFAIVQSIPKNWKVATTYQASIICFHGKTIPRKKTPESLLWRCYTFTNSLVSSTVTIWRSRWRLSHLSISFYRWLGLQWSLQSDQKPQAQNKNLTDLPKSITLASALKRTELSVFYLILNTVSIADKRAINDMTSQSHSIIWFFNSSTLLNSHPPFGFSS